MYLVRLSFVNRFGSPFSWDFEVERQEPDLAIYETVKIFMSGLTTSEQEDAAATLEVMAHPRYLPR
jgi:hypothetical protein